MNNLDTLSIDEIKNAIDCLDLNYENLTSSLTNTFNLEQYNLHLCFSQIENRFSTYYNGILIHHKSYVTTLDELAEYIHTMFLKYKLLLVSDSLN